MIASDPLCDERLGRDVEPVRAEVLQQSLARDVDGSDRRIDPSLATELVAVVRKLA